MIDTTTVTIIALIGNMIVNCFLAYLYRYRANIETRQIQIMEENAESKKCLRIFRQHIRLEREEIKKMTPEELDEFLDELEHLGEEC